MLVRPDPDALLRRVERDEQAGRRGRLKVFFGAAPGVGKTYAMLEAARVARAGGTDVVIGWLETHGRAETEALAAGLERLAPRAAEQRGVRLREFDLDAALARRPALLLLDELAHTNAPGARHPKRWQDAVELVDAGIDVWTTLNVQHLESVNDLVQRITGVQVRETVPDHLLDEADAVEFVDLPPEELLRRLAEGKVYVPDQAARAVRSFFRKGNLTALRELALRRTAEHVDAAVRDYRADHAIEATWPVAERVLVCVRPNPESQRLVRGARRLAARLRAEWLVVWVESPGQPALSQEERRLLAAAFALAEQLGAETATVTGASVPAAVLRFARERNVSKLVVGKPAHARWRDRHPRLARGRDRAHERRPRRVRDLGRGRGPGARAAPGAALPAARLRLRGGGGGGGHRALARAARPARQPEPRDDLPARGRARGHPLRPGPFGLRRGGERRRVRLLLRAAAPDVRGLRHAVPRDLRRDAGRGAAGQPLAARVREVAEMALQRETRTRALYALSRELGGLRDPREVAAAGARHAALVLHGEAAVLLARGGGLEPVGEPLPAFAADPRETRGRPVVASSTAGPRERRPTRCPGARRALRADRGQPRRGSGCWRSSCPRRPGRSPPSSATC